MNENHSLIKRAINILKSADQLTDPATETQFYSKIKLLFSTMKLCLQLTAAYSQFGLHKKALKASQKSLQYLSYVCSNIHALFQDSEALGIAVTEETKRRLRANELLRSEYLSFFKNQKDLTRVIDEILNGFQKNDTEFLSGDGVALMDRVDPACKCTKLEPDWIKNISIASFMHIEYITLEKISQQICFEEIFHQNFLSLLIMTSAAIQFTIATENRFICLENYAMGANVFKIKSVFEKNHQQRIRKIKKFIFSEKLHQHAISLLQNRFRPNSLLTHLISSFEKNYQTNHCLENIVK